MRGKLAAVATALGAAGAYGLLRGRKPMQTKYSEAPKKVLIVGGGFGGLAAL
jgi:NADPH-dependent 2,4-dienoyl-CoA reductase/sulfur reductase-like enzyme